MSDPASTPAAKSKKDDQSLSLMPILLIWIVVSLVLIAIESTQLDDQDVKEAAIWVTVSVVCGVAALLVSLDIYVTWISKRLPQPTAGSTDREDTTP
jgi:hypothetical protein